MYFSVCFLMLCILYTDVIRIVLGEEYIRFPHEVYVQVPDEGMLDEGIHRSKAYTTTAKGSLVSSMFVVTSASFEYENYIRILSVVNAQESNVTYCPAMFHFRSERYQFDILVIPGNCKLVTPETYVIRVPKSNWMAEPLSEAAVSYKETGTYGYRTYSQDHWSRNLTIEKIYRKRAYFMTAESDGLRYELLEGSSLVQNLCMIGVLTVDCTFGVINLDALKQYIAALLSGQDEP